MPLEPKDLEDIFSYHAPDDLQRVALERIREAAHIFAFVLLQNTPASADQSAAIRKLRECVMTANASVVLKGRY
jgi:plasmid stabilization system protein ParE